jgi:hypothetical protein
MISLTSLASAASPSLSRRRRKPASGVAAADVGQGGTPAPTRTPVWWTAFLRRVGPPAQRARELFPLTTSGVLVALGSAWAFQYYGMGRIDLILLVIGAIGLALVALSVIAVVVGALALRPWITQIGESGTRTLECGVWSQSGVKLPALRWLPFVHIAWRWVSPDARVAIDRTGRWLLERVLPRRRTIVSSVERYIDVTDVFGLAGITLRHRATGQVTVIPAAGALNRIRVVKGLAGGHDLSHPDGPPTGDRIDLRPYAPGDPVRLVLWKVFARSRRLVVRTPERAISPVQKTIAYMVAGPDDEASAGAARSALEDGSLGEDWVLGADGTDTTTSEVGEALTVLARSGTAAEPVQGIGLHAFLSGDAASLGSRAIVFVPASPGVWLARAAAAARGSTASIEFIIAFDGIDRSAVQSRWKRLVMQSAPDDDAGAVPIQELRKVVDALQGTGAGVTLLDRKLGRAYPGNQLGGAT